MVLARFTKRRNLKSLQLTSKLTMEKVDRGRADAVARFGKRGKLDKQAVEIIAKVDV